MNALFHIKEIEKRINFSAIIIYLYFININFNNFKYNIYRDEIHSGKQKIPRQDY
jgi:hypothetical protein